MLFVFNEVNNKKGGEYMQYRLHDVPKEIWAFVKARAHVEELSINDFLIALLSEYKNRREGQYTGKDLTYTKRPKSIID